MYCLVPYLLEANGRFIIISIPIITTRGRQLANNSIQEQGKRYYNCSSTASLCDLLSLIVAPVTEGVVLELVPDLVWR